MNYIFNKSLYIALIICITYTSVNAVRLDCSGDYKLTTKGKPQGVHHPDIERAGVVLLKDYGRDEPGKPNSRYAIILGHTRGTQNHYLFQAGKCERNDRFTTVTASRELAEETGGAVTISAQALSDKPYIYAAQKQLFFIRNDRLSVHQISQACQRACKNKRLPSSKREIDNAVAVPISDILRLAEQIRRNMLRARSYTLRSRTGNHVVHIDGYYMRMLAYRYPQVKQILGHLFPGAHF